MELAIGRLRERHPWPAEMPGVPEDWHGWLSGDTAAMLCSHLTPETRLVVECGSWLGMSARAIVQSAPRAILICCDHWKGSSEHQPGTSNRDWSRRLPTLFETFVRNMWPWRERIVPLRADTLEGLAEIHAAGLSPDLVYLDSEHTWDRVGRELAFCTGHWPSAVLVGDDYSHPDVARAANDHARRTGRKMTASAASFCLE